MNKAQTIKWIRSLGITVTCRDGEWRINYPESKGGTEATAYYTTDATDAHDTARRMASDPVRNSLLPVGTMVRLTTDPDCYARILNAKYDGKHALVVCCLLA